MSDNITNETIVGWFHDLIPEIKETGNPETTFLKFASEENLAPALLERLGQVFNTAKTVNYLDKQAAERGANFEVLDVPAMLEKYSHVPAADSKTSAPADSDRVEADLFGQSPDSILDGLGVLKLEPMDGYEEAKLASDQSQMQKAASVAGANLRQIEQLQFDVMEDNRELASKFASLLLTDPDLEFVAIERDAKYVYEEHTKEACDLLHGFLKAAGYDFDRAETGGPNRLVDSSLPLRIVGQVQNNLNSISVMDKQAFSEPFQKQAVGVGPIGGSRIGEQDLDLEGSTRVVDQRVGKKRKPKEDLSGVGYDETAKGLEDAGSAIHGAIGSFGQYLNKTLPPGKGSLERGVKAVLKDPDSSEAQKIDQGQAEVEQQALLQNLMISDEILSEADPEKVINAYNTIKKLSPELSKDVNIMRVALRSAIAHDGVGFFDAQQALGAEQDMQKVLRNQQQDDRDRKPRQDDKKR